MEKLKELFKEAEQISDYNVFINKFFFVKKLLANDVELLYGINDKEPIALSFNKKLFKTTSKNKIAEASKHISRSEYLMFKSVLS